MSEKTAANARETWNAYEETNRDRQQAWACWTAYRATPNPDPEKLAELESEWESYRAADSAAYDAWLDARSDDLEEMM